MPPTVTTLDSFDSAAPGPIGILLADASGNLFGATYGSYQNYGTVFEITNSNGVYSSTPAIISSFDGKSASNPAAGLISDSSGNLFGATFYGGSSDYGTVFEITQTSGTYNNIPTILMSFNGGDGEHPDAGLIADPSGDLFGTTETGGTYSEGTVFEITKINGAYSSTPTVLASFDDGGDPRAGLIMDSSGDLFGTTYSGGAYGFGSVFEITNTNSNYSKTPTNLVSFDGLDRSSGANPSGELVADASGDLFGTTTGGGDNDVGTVFEIMNTDGIYSNAPITLSSLAPVDSGNAEYPAGNLIVDAAGDLFGTTLTGQVFEIAKTNGMYDGAPKILADFGGLDAPDGLSSDASGNLFGTTGAGGANYMGTVFEITDSGFVTSVACYCRGTLIATDHCEMPVENLTVGDGLVTASGAIRPIKWIGTRSYAGRFANANPDVLPVCFKAGSLGESIPRRDLWVSPKHAMVLDGVLIPAEHLVNDVSIVQAEQVERVDYFHVELHSHDIIVAEGALSETFVDDRSRGMFHNAHEFAALFPDADPVEARYCAPRVEDGFVLDAVRRRLARRAGLRFAAPTEAGSLRGSVERIEGGVVHGWAQSAGSPDGPVCLDVLVDGAPVARGLAERFRPDLLRAGIGDGSHAFDIRLPDTLSHADRRRIEVRRAADGAVVPVLETLRHWQSSALDAA